MCNYLYRLGNWKTINNINYLITKFFITIVELTKTTELLHIYIYIYIYIYSEIFEYTETIVIGRVSFLCSKIRLDNKDELIISAIYRCHDILKTEFIWSVKKYIMNYINSKNHCLIGDFNMNIMSKSLDSAHDMTLSQDFFNHLLEHKFTPCFLEITRRDPQNIFGDSCIDNMYLPNGNHLSL